MERETSKKMNDSEKGESSREVLLCEKALEIYWSAKLEFIRSGSSHEPGVSIRRDAEYLVRDAGREGLRVSFPTNNTRLHFEINVESGEPYFWIWGNGNGDEKRFDEWQEFIAKKFQEGGLNLRK